MKLHAHIRNLARRLGIIGIVSAFSMLALGAAVPTTFAQAATPQKCAKDDVKCVISAGDQLIADRLTSLTTLSNRVAEELKDDHITTDQANALQSDITTNRNGLATLKSKLDAETNAQAARQDVRNIFLIFRIYAVVLPRDYQQLHFNIEQNLHNKMHDAEPKIQQAIAKAPASKQAQLNALFNDYKMQLVTAEGRFDTVQTNLPTLTPQNYNTNRSTYESNLSAVRVAEKTAHTALHQAAKDLHQIAQLLK